MAACSLIVVGDGTVAAENPDDRFIFVPRAEKTTILSCVGRVERRFAQRPMAAPGRQHFDEHSELFRFVQDEVYVSVIFRFGATAANTLAGENRSAPAMRQAEILEFYFTSRLLSEQLLQAPSIQCDCQTGHLHRRGGILQGVHPKRPERRPVRNAR